MWMVCFGLVKEWVSNSIARNSTAVGLGQCDGLLTLPDRDSDPNPVTDIHPKYGYISDWGSESG